MSENPGITFPVDPIRPTPIEIPIRPSTETDTTTEMGVHFAHNLPDLVATETAEPVQLTIQIDGATIVEAMTLTPDADRRITIPVHRFARGIEPIAGPGAVCKALPTMRIEIRFSETSKTTYMYDVIPGGVATPPCEMFDYLLANFLTSQPQIIETTQEQPQWLAFVRPHTTDNIVVAETPEQYAYNQVDTSFRTLWWKLCREENLTPVAYDVFGTSVVSRSHVTNPEPDRPIGQRYLLRPPQPDEHCFGFINGMGGFDTLMMQGSSILKPEGENKTFIHDEAERELTNGYTSYWEASTGYIDTERMAAQYQDFLKSTDRWIYHREKWLRIIVDEYKVEHTPRELNAYTFKYHFAEQNEYRDFERIGLPEVELPTIL